MYFYTNGNLAWLMIAKNACSSWSNVFEKLGWQKHDLYIPDIDLDSLSFFGFLQDPDKRHTAGVVQYLINENLSHLVNDSNYQKLLTSACFDEHSYSIHSLVPDFIRKRTTWFILDNSVFDYETLVKNYLKTHNVIVDSVPRLNSSAAFQKHLKEKINQLKQQYPNSHSKLVKNFLGLDLRLYRNEVLNQHLWYY